MMFTLPRLMVCTLDLINPCHSVVHPRMAEVPPLAAAVGLTVCNRRFLDRLECSIEDPEPDADTFDRMQVLLRALAERGIHGLTLELDDGVEARIFEPFSRYVSLEVRPPSRP